MVLPLIVAANACARSFEVKNAPVIALPLICALTKAVEGPSSVTMQLPDASWRSDLSFEIVPEPVSAVPAWTKPAVIEPENVIGASLPQGTNVDVKDPLYVPVRPEAGGCVLV